MTVLVAAVVLGVAGSGHCALMCGPLVSLLAPARASWPARWTHAALYHVGRLAMYAAIGAGAGALGEMAMFLGLGRLLAVAAGALLIASAVGVERPRRWPDAFTRAADAAVSLLRRLQIWTIAHRMRGPLTGGAINGLLPCGLVYGAMAGSAGLGSIAEGTAFMLAFGIGTAPVLLAFGLTRGAVASASSRYMRRLAPLALAAVGMLLLLRGIGASAERSPGDASAPMHAAHGMRP